MRKWTKIKKLASGHHVFRADNGRYALVDDSGDTPDQADDGVLWLDASRALQLHTDWLRIPVRNHTGQPYVVMAEPRDLTVMATLHTRWTVEVTPEARQLRDLVNAVERYAARPAACDHSDYVTRLHPDTGEEQPFGTVISRIDRYGRAWTLSEAELCPECGQPDNCGDCTHEPLTAAQVVQIGGQDRSHE